MTAGDMSAEAMERFWSKVDKRGPTECWEWKGAKSSGYGSFVLSGRPSRAHRISAAMAGMKIEGMIVRHKCDNRPCVNPRHLEPGTVADNGRDMWRRGRQGGFAAVNAAKTHCPKGHEFTGYNLRVTPRGLRACRTCHREHGKDYMRRRNAIRNSLPEKGE